MSLQPVLIAGQWREAQDPTDTFSATNPAAKSSLPERYPVSGRADVEAALKAAQEAVAALRSRSPEDIAGFLERFADNIEARADELVTQANLETAYPVEPRLRSVELPRTTDQLRQAAAAVRERSWCHATIDTKSNIRSKLGPLGGPVVVFGPNNFPFAFNSAAGGDFAAAIAAGNPVIAKANTGHPGTTKLLTEAAFEAVKSSGLPHGMIQLLYRTPPEVGLELVSHPLVGATGFTGSRPAGLKLKAAADKAGKPIYLEMSSVNPVFVLPGALRERSSEVANDLYASCSLGAGQFCTNPGLAVVPQGKQGETFLEQVKGLFEGNPAGTLLGAGGPGGIAEGIGVLLEHGAELVCGGQELDGPGYSFANTLLRVSGQAFLENPDALQTEAFGTVNLMVFAENTAQMIQIAAHLEGNLTGCIYSHTGGEDDIDYDQIAPILREKVGRLLNDKMPTGVAVVSAMNHGGPFPATGHPGFTAVGILASITRFSALHCFDEVRPHRLPPELRNENPTGRMWRLIDGEWSQGNIEG
ncbi:MAG: aldehyde dehydrogenase (NADP(+)) [Trueperaceae bacterium]|nr:MAG: aldehyde dehydrogenase (NADP(+)) [Trueperaceae bacterium]